MSGAATATVAWIIAISFAANPSLRARTDLALGTLALSAPHRTLVGARSFPGLAGIFAPAADPAHLPQPLADQSGEASAPTRTAASVVEPPPNEPTQQADAVPLPTPRSPEGRQIQVHHESAAPPTVAPAPQLAAAVAPLPAAASFNLFQKLPASTSSDFFPKRRAPQPAHNTSLALLDPTSHTAIYDIEAHTVYLPNGQRLEAHSGLGNRLDDPRYVNEKARGPTPPNVYDLVLREEAFHGIRAIRLNPLDESKMHGRDGILAHTYMLGPSGQSFGCVSFKNYPDFLRAFLKGEIDRLVVVPHLEAKPADDRRAGAGDTARYALDSR